MFNVSFFLKEILKSFRYFPGNIHSHKYEWKPSEVRPTGNGEVAGSIPAGSDNISWRLDNYFLWPFSPDSREAVVRLWRKNRQVLINRLDDYVC